ncbi:hypothetical protein ACM46_06660 [Chryseobacterium angstadtii]|uniref:Right handed beta helix domain-containing protein n=1 Tax=Chryseobacterium angstadtii TaxID=558151 RepID=A0A0J7IHV2_9FLAO|nr:hypothetical protein ACM46_06660 [Chryseobacterium angstadtii]
MWAQKPVVSYSAYAQKSQKDHTASLTRFLQDVSKKNAVGIIDGYTIEFNKEISIKNLNNIELSFKNSVLYSNKRFSGFFLNFVNSKNIVIDGMNVEMYRTALPVYTEKDYPNVYNSALGFKGCQNIEIKNSKFLNLYNRSVQITESYGKISVHDNFFSSKKQNQKYLMEHVVVGSSPNGVVSILKNRFDNESYDNPDFGISAISGYGLGKGEGKVDIIDNYINNAGRSNSGLHRLFAIDFYDDCDNITVKGNTISNVMWGAVRFNGSSVNTVISDNIITIKNPDDSSSITSSTTAGSQYFRNISINNNTITAISGLNSAIMLQNQFENIKTENISIKNNKINNSYNNISLVGYFDDVTVSQNVIKGSGAAVGISFMLKNKSAGKQIYINDNIIHTFNTGISLNSTDNKANNNGFTIRNNEVNTTNKSFKGYGIIVNLGMKGKINIEQNNILNFATGLYLRENTVNTKLNKFDGNAKNLSKD